MPIYPIKCLDCGHQQEILCKHSDLPEEEKKFRCEMCGSGRYVLKLAPFVSHFNYTKGK
jgi:predicted nucleic acid-binding Zn ribbon protein